MDSNKRLPVTDPAPTENPSRRAGVIVTPGTNTYLLSIPKMVFDAFPAEPHRWDVRLCAANIGNVEAMADMSVAVTHDYAWLDQADTIIVPYWNHPEMVPDAALLDALKKAAGAGKEIVGLCLGAYVLAYAGLLDGRRAVTHWRFAEDFQKRFPRVRVDERKLYEDDGGMVTSAGISAGMDCCLYLLRKHEGAQVANTVARDLVTPPFREGGQVQYIEESVPTNTRNARIDLVLDTLRKDLKKPHSIAQMASLSLMSERTFARVFRKTTGMTPAQWLLQARIRHAEELLETTDLSVEAVSGECGFSSPVTFRQAFATRKGVSPINWKRTFTGRNLRD